MDELDFTNSEEYNKIMFSLSDLDILFQYQNLAVSILCDKIQFILNFLTLFFREMIVSIVAPSVNTEEFSGSYPQPRGGLWAAWRLCEVTDKTAQSQ